MQIEKRYEYYSATGKRWTSWFKDPIRRFNTKEEALDYISKKPKIVNKLKLEYRISDE